MKGARIAVVWILLAAQGVAAQQGHPRRRPSHIPPPDSLIAEVRAGGGLGRGPSYAVMGCPRRAPWRDSIFRGLLALPIDDVRVVSILSVSWGRALRECTDHERIGAWYRRVLAGSPVESALRTTMAVLMDDPAPADVEAVRAYAFDTDRPEELRSAALSHLSIGLRLTPEVELELIEAAYLESGELPNPWYYATVGNLRAPAHQAALARLLMSLVERRPDAPVAPRVLAELVQTPGDEWIEELAALMRRLQADEDVPAELREMASRFDRRRRRPHG